MKRPAMIFTVILAGCATPLTRQADNVQLLAQDSAIIPSCQKIGMVNVTQDSSELDVATTSAINAARNKAAAMGADALVINNIDRNLGLFSSSATAHGVALKCQ